MVAEGRESSINHPLGISAIHSLKSPQFSKPPRLLRLHDIGILGHLIPNLHWLHLQKFPNYLAATVATNWKQIPVQTHLPGPAWKMFPTHIQPTDFTHCSMLSFVWPGRKEKRERERDRHHGWTQYFGSNSRLMLIVWPMFPNRRTVSLCPFQATHLEDGGPGIMLYDLQRVFQVHQVPRADDGIQVTLI